VVFVGCGVVVTREHTYSDRPTNRPTPKMSDRPCEYKPGTGVTSFSSYITNENHARLYDVSTNRGA